MGIPALFRWLTQKYPKVTSPVVEEFPVDLNGEMIPVDYSQPNPNQEEFHNLYLDMSGIIHPCCHPEDKPPPKTEEEMFVEIFKYIDRIMSIIRPRRLLYMAIDGVAPRAKMNQQRSRRFRAALEAQQKIADEQRLKEQWEADHGKKLDSTAKEHFDSNCITPGTPFMANLAEALKYYIAERMNSNPAWKNLKVILSDANVPGEGEHKIMDYIRRQRSLPSHDPNTSHVLYGLDADLIMLALATHEPHFKILREDVFVQQGSIKVCGICSQPGHDVRSCPGKVINAPRQIGYFTKPYIFLHVSVLREYLELELSVHGLPFPYDFERAIDDFVCLCFFVGNDFLPHLPSLEIREGAIDTLMDVWKQKLVDIGGYLTENGELDIYRLKVIVEEVGKHEDTIFQNRRETEMRRMDGRRRRAEQMKNEQERMSGIRDAKKPENVVETMKNLPTWSVKDFKRGEIGSVNSEIVEAKKMGATWGGPGDAKAKANKAAALMLKAQLVGKDATDLEKSESGVKRKLAEISNDEVPNVEDALIVKSKDEFHKEVILEDSEKSVAFEETSIVQVDTEVQEPTEEVIFEEEEVVEAMVVTDIPPMPKKPPTEEEEPEDNVRLWEEGWKERYYDRKFGVHEADTDFRKTIIEKYVEGLCWVLKYYYQGCPSWQWYFPYHFSPFASDFELLSPTHKVEFTPGKPFRPFQQLMGVFPKASGTHIPAPFRPLMEPTSIIGDFYPEIFQIDMDGKKYAWQGVVMLPFIEEKRLLKAMEEHYSKLTDEEKERDKEKDATLWIGENHRLFDKLCVLYARQVTKPLPLESRLAEGMVGSVLPDPMVCLPGSRFSVPFEYTGIKDVEDNQCISVLYLSPEFPAGHIFKAKFLSGANLPKRILDGDDYFFIKTGCVRGRNKFRAEFSFSGRGRYNNDNQYGRQQNNQPGQRNYGQSQNYAGNNNYVRDSPSNRGRSNQFDQRNRNYPQDSRSRGSPRGGYHGQNQQRNFSGGYMAQMPNSPHAAAQFSSQQQSYQNQSHIQNGQSGEQLDEFGRVINPRSQVKNPAWNQIVANSAQPPPKRPRP